MPFLTKDSAAPATKTIALDLVNQSYRRAFLPSRWGGVKQILKGNAVSDTVRGALPMLPVGQSIATSQPSLFQRIKGAANYAMQGDPRAFFPPGYALAPQAPDQAKGRKYDYPFYYNVQIQPRAYESISFDLLRQMSDAHDLLRTVIESAKNRISFQEWSIMQTEDGGKPGKKIPGGTKDRMQWATSFFRRPDNNKPFSAWARELLEDMLTIDAMSIYNKPTLSGDPHSFQAVDGATINVKLDYWGREPETPEVAYQQIIKGLPAIDYDADTLLYFPFNRRVHKAYGYSPVEQILVTVNIAIRRQWYQLQHYISGAHTPYLIKTPPEWDQDQIESAQTWYNSQFVDNLAQRWRAILLPSGCEPLPSTQIQLKDEMDDWLASLICYAFSVDRAQLTKPMNRASAQHGGSQADKEGFLPFSEFFEDSMNELIYRCFGWEDIRFAWKAQENLMDPDREKAISGYMEHGVFVIDEVRDMHGLDPLPNGAGQQCVLGSNMQLVQIDDVNKLSDQNAQQAQQVQAQQQTAMEAAKNPATHVHIGAGSGANNKGGVQASNAKSNPKNGGKAKAGGNAGKGASGGNNAVKKAFDVSPSPTSGLQPYGGPKRRAKVTIREPSDDRVKKLKAAVAKKLKEQGKRVADQIVKDMHESE